MITIQSLDALVTPAVVAIFNDANYQLSKTLHYGNLGFSDYEPSFNSPAFQNISGASEAVLTLEGMPYAPEDVIQNYKTTITVQKYTKLMPISEETVHWIQKGNKEKAQEFRDVVVACANGLNQKVDQEAVKVYYLGFGTTFQTGGDGVALFAYNHPSPDSSVAIQRNIPTVAEGMVPLTRDSLTNAFQRMNRFYDIKGVQLEPCDQLTLIVAIEGRENARAILYSVQGPTTANLGINPIAQQYSNIQLEVAPWIPPAYSTYWFLIDKKRASRALWMVWGWKARINSETEYSNGTLYKAGSVYFKPGFTDWRFGYASKGDNSVIAN